MQPKSIGLFYRGILDTEVDILRALKKLNINPPWGKVGLTAVVNFW
jgi:hypothetical protein